MRWSDDGEVEEVGESEDGSEKVDEEEVDETGKREGRMTRSGEGVRESVTAK